MRGLCIALLCCALPLSQASSRDTTTIAAFGDSLFAGFGVAPEDALPAQLEKKLNAGGFHVQVINDGVSGETTSGGLARLPKVLAQKPDIVLLELGANDMLRGTDPALTRSNLDKMLTQLKQAHIRVLVVGQKALRNFGMKFVTEFDPLFCDLARQYNAPCYPFFYDGVYGHPQLMQPDGIHPNAQGVKVVLDKLYPYVTGLLKK